MRSINSLLWGVLARPRSTLAAAVDRPPLALSFGLLLIAGLVMAVTYTDPLLAGDDGLLFTLLMPFLLIVYLTMALAMAGTARLMKKKLRLRSLFCLLVLADVPALVASPLNFWTDQHYLAHRLGQVLAVALLGWSTALLLLGLRSGYALSRGSALLVAMPAVLFTWPLTYWSEFVAPPPMPAAHPWQRVEGSRVVVYAPRGTSLKEIEEIARGCDETLVRIYQLLKVEGLSFRVGVYLFPDDKLHRRIVDDSETEGSAYFHGRDVSMVYEPWKLLNSTMAHELGHVVVEHRIARNLRSFLGEGLATYIKYADAEEPDLDVLQREGETPLRDLVRSEVFWDVATSAAGGEDLEAYYLDVRYLDAGSFVQHMIERHGLAKMKRLCREWSRRTGPWWCFWTDESEAFSAAVLDVYGVSVDAIAAEWEEAERESGL
jgi:hypothetical protein